MAKAEVKYNVIIAETGEVVCSDCATLTEAAQCKKELVELDRAYGVYEEGFYKIKRA